MNCHPSGSRQRGQKRSVLIILYLPTRVRGFVDKADVLLVIQET
jgi:hypothetical protein